jgi:NAD(P)-dependent dehydrogenase (short-subunit alcohol dehydrogenase family)
VITTYRGASAAPALRELAQRHASLVAHSMDVSDERQVAALANRLRASAIDVLIHNAGLYSEPDGSFATQSIGAYRFALLEQMLAVNVKGPLVSQAFLPHLRAGERRQIVCMSSTNGSLTQPFAGGGATFYRTSKAALNRAMQVMAEELHGERIGVLLLHPGMVRTERFFEHRERRGDATPLGPDSLETPAAVAQMIETIDSAGYAPQARFLRYDGATLAW